jgi:hypothetical protein
MKSRFHRRPKDSVDNGDCGSVALLECAADWSEYLIGGVKLALEKPGMTHALFAQHSSAIVDPRDIVQQEDHV